MQSPRWKLFFVLWALTVGLWVLPYVMHRTGSLDVKNALSLYPWNFSPFYALSLFGGAYLSRKGLAIVLPALAYACVNLMITWLSGKPSWANQPEVWANYALFMLFPVFGLGLQKSQAPQVPAMGRSIAAAVAYFVASNFVCFLTAYPLTMTGLGECFTMALPFFPATLISSVVFTVVLFSPIGAHVLQPAEARVR